jgi:hypothetical protein
MYPQLSIKTKCQEKEKEIQLGLRMGVDRALSIPPQKVKDRFVGAISPCRTFGLDAFSLLNLRREEARKRKIPMNISCSASTDFFVP